MKPDESEPRYGQKMTGKFHRVLKYVSIHIFIHILLPPCYKSTNVTECTLLNVYSFYKMHCNPIALSSPSEFFAEILNNKYSPIYIVTCDPLLKLLAIPLHHVIEYILIDFARVYIWYMQEGISLPVKD